MQITVNLSKAELDLIEEALLQYQNLLLQSEGQDKEMVKYELGLCRRVFEELGMEDLAETREAAPNQQGQQGNQTNQIPSSTQFPFSR